MTGPRSALGALPHLPSRLVRAVSGEAGAVANAWGAVAGLAHTIQVRSALAPVAAHSHGDDEHRVLQLSREECWELLRTQEVGRIAVCAHSRTPVILPVNYAVRAGQIVIRTGPGPKLSAAERGDVVAFEVDDLDRSGRRGWSVVVSGTARRLSSDRERAEIASTGLAPWVGGPRADWIAITPRHVSGRRVG